MKIQWCIVLILFAAQLPGQDPNVLDSLKQKILDASNDSLRCEARIDLALFLYAGDEAVRYAREALETAREHQWQHLIGKSYYALAWCHPFEEMEQKTLYLDSALLAFDGIHDLDGLGLTSNTQAVMFMEYGIYDQAISSYENAFHYYLESGDRDRQALILNNWGACLNEMKEPALAIEKYQAALSYEESQVPVNHLKLGRIYHGLAESNRQMEQYGQSAKFDIQAYSVRKKSGNIAQAETLIHMADLISEVIEKKVDTITMMDDFRQIGFTGVLDLLNKAESFPGVADRPDFQYTILDAKRHWYLVNGAYQDAYRMLDTLKRFDEQQKLNPTSLAALAGLKVKYEKEILNRKLLEAAFKNQKKANQVNILLLFLSLIGALSIIGFLWYQNRMRRNSLLLAEAKQEQQIIAMRSLLEGQEQERSRIARDLHDGLGNLLSSIKANMSSLYIEFDDSGTRRIYHKASDMIDEACTEVRKMAHEMMPQALKKVGLTNALNDLVNRMNFSHPFHTEFNVYGKEQDLGDQFNIMIYRIIQECYNNIVKYAQASEVLLQLTFSEEWLNVTIEDNGVGFDLKSIPADKGMGLKSIDFRARFMGGDYEIDSRPGEGTMVTINVPIRPQ
ncbi:MAG: sensor histidine kinase [Saprospiraceae bacterium]|nr:sensor histidine kinase [Saprospiraceae bacterium]MCB9321347.1 sensor histidine kinase [Lewinellaceae bacterium]